VDGTIKTNVVKESVSNARVIMRRLLTEVLSPFSGSGDPRASRITIGQSTATCSMLNQCILEVGMEAISFSYKEND
jgi:hypothetical protein